MPRFLKKKSVNIISKVVNPPLRTDVTHTIYAVQYSPSLPVSQSLAAAMMRGDSRYDRVMFTRMHLHVIATQHTIS